MNSNGNVHQPVTNRPNTAVVPENTNAVRNMIEMEHHLTYRQIGTSLGNGETVMQKILHKHFFLMHAGLDFTQQEKKARII